MTFFPHTSFNIATSLKADDIFEKIRKSRAFAPDNFEPASFRMIIEPNSFELKHKKRAVQWLWPVAICNIREDSGTASVEVEVRYTWQAILLSVVFYLYIILQALGMLAGGLMSSSELSWFPLLFGIILIGMAVLSYSIQLGRFRLVADDYHQFLLEELGFA